MTQLISNSTFKVYDIDLSEFASEAEVAQAEKEFSKNYWSRMGEWDWIVYVNRDTVDENFGNSPRFLREIVNSVLESVDDEDFYVQISWW